jgi:hypothetical protein
VNSQIAVTLHRVAAFCFTRAQRSPLSELARVLLRLDHVACFIVNASGSREILGNHCRQSQQSRLELGLRQRLIPTGERSGLLTRIAAA